MRERAPYVDVVLGTHNVHRAAELLARGRRRRSGHRDPRGGRARRPRAVPVGAAGAARDVATTPGSRSRSAATTRCAFCIVPAVRGAEISRPFGDIVDEVARAGRRTASPRSRCSARTSTATAATSQLAARRDGDDVGARLRPLFADLLRRRRRRRRHPPGPLHQPAPEGPAPRDDRGHGRRRRRCASTCTSRCSPAATASWRRCTAATPPSATSSGWPRPGPPSPTWP